MEVSHYLGRPTWADINLTNLAFNVREFRQFLPDAVKLMAVVKADAYGHGAFEVAEVALQKGASVLGVASLEEGVALRQKGIRAPILILGYTDCRQYFSLLEMQLTPTVFSWEAASSLSQQAHSQGKRVAIHVKIDTGMGRLGLTNLRDTVNFLERVAALPGIILEGLYTHFATADESDKSFSRQQLRLFNNVLDACEERMINISLRHAANSSAVLELPEYHLDKVRFGIGSYGCCPSKNINNKVKLLPVMSLKSRVIFLKKVPAGTPVSYGRTYFAPEDTIIATVPLGYGDGYNRLLSNNGFMLIRGHKAPIAGRVCMDHTMLDVGKIPFVQEGDEVVAYGRQGQEEIHVDKIAGQLGTISYEVLCNIGSRVPRVYWRDGKIENIKYAETCYSV